MTTYLFLGRIIILVHFLRCGNASPNRRHRRAAKSAIYLLYYIADAHGSAIRGRTPEEAGSYHSYQLSIPEKIGDIDGSVRRATNSVIHLLYYIADAHGSTIRGRTPEKAGSYHSHQLSLPEKIGDIDGNVAHSTYCTFLCIFKVFLLFCSLIFPYPKPLSFFK